MNGFGSHQELLAENAIYQAIYQGQTGGADDAEEKTENRRIVRKHYGVCGAIFTSTKVSCWQPLY